MVSPTTIRLLIVPKPGRWRSGIHSSRTKTLTMIAQVPTPNPNRRERPWCSTSQGSTPSPASSSIDALIPYMRSPA